MENNAVSNNMNAEEQEKDLPLSSNFKDVKVEHFVLDLSCSIANKIFDVVITLFCKLSSDTNESEKIVKHPIKDLAQAAVSSSQQEELNHINVSNSQFCISLDCFALDVSSCNLYLHTPDWASFFNAEQETLSKKQLQISKSCMDNYHCIYESLQSSTQHSIPLKFFVSKHSLKILLPHNMVKEHSVVVSIGYKTRPEGPSLRWTLDQCARPCVFTAGHLLNNRSLFPSQDLPQAMSTWHCSVVVTDTLMEQVSVVMTGESEPEISLNKNGAKVFNFCSSYPMPSSTFALAVGSWSVTEIINSTNQNDLEPERCTMPHCRIFSPECLHEHSVSQLSRYLPACFEVLNSLVGPYPLKHMDILFMPDCFDCLGLACPHLMLLSQSLLSPDLSILYRLSHELCHTWFGILTGPQDWTEEWLTEGVCCYLEDIVHAAVMKWDEDEIVERCYLRTLLKFRTLVSEVSSTPEALQTLRPNSGEMNDQQMFVKNGLNYEKTVMQVHYLKGFFLLKYLEDIAGQVTFLQALKSFISEYLGQLFSSKDLLDFIFENCPQLSGCGLSVEKICEDWLDNPGIPQHLKNFSSKFNNRLIMEVETEVSRLKMANSKKRVKCQSLRNQKAVANDTQSSKQLLPEQMVLLFEMLVEEHVSLTAADFKSLRETHNIKEANAEVKHSWCELVISKKATQWIQDVKDFLTHHQALGVYLYGELLISQNKKLQRVAYDCYSRAQDNMPEGPKTIVSSMLFPS